MLLSKRQQQLASSHLLPHIVVTGKGQTGKTTLGMARVNFLLERYCNEEDEILFIVPSEEDKVEVEALYNRLEVNQAISLFTPVEPRRHLIIKDIKSLVLEYVHASKQVKGLTVIDTICPKLLEKALLKVRKDYPKVKSIQKMDYRALIKEIILIRKHYILSLEEYQQSVGFKKEEPSTLRLYRNSKNREAIYALMQEIDELLLKKGQIHLLKAALLVVEELKHLKSKKTYRYIVIDEAQKLSKMELELIKALTSQRAFASTLYLIGMLKEGYQGEWLVKGRSVKTLGDKIIQYKLNEKWKKEQIQQKEKIHQIEKIQQKEEIQQLEKGFDLEKYLYIDKITRGQRVFKRDLSAREIYEEDNIYRKEELLAIKMYSDIAAGQPIEISDEDRGEFYIPSSFIHNRSKAYIVPVKGDSMIGADIYDGDYAVIEGNSYVRSGEIGAVYYNGGITLKRIVQDGDEVLLESENIKYQPIRVESEDFRVMGKLIGVIKSL